MKEPLEETRICCTPKEVKQLVTQLQHDVFIETGYGEGLGISNEAFEHAGATLGTREEVLQQARYILAINELPAGDSMTNGSTYIGIYTMLFYPDRVTKYRNKEVNVYSLDLLPRTTLAQSMDVLSSMASLSGHKAVLKAANYYKGCLPMFTTAAGTLTPAKVLVLGAGVAGLQAIATAKRLGAVVEAFDVRKSAAEEVKSLGAKFIEVEGFKEGENAGGYAVEQSEEYLAKQKKLIEERIALSNIVISTANIPGKKAPVLIEAKAVDAMSAGSVIIDLAAEQGGNCVKTVAGKTIQYQQVTIEGNSYLSREMPKAASQLLASNFFNFLNYLLHATKEDDPLIRGCQVISNGHLVHPQLVNKFELA